MEEFIAGHPAVAECAVTGIDDELRGQVPVGFVVLKDGVEMSQEQMQKELVDIIRRDIGAVAYFRQSGIVKRLPKHGLVKYYARLFVSLHSRTK